MSATSTLGAEGLAYAEDTLCGQQSSIAEFFWLPLAVLANILTEVQRPSHDSLVTLVYYEAAISLFGECMLCFDAGSAKPSGASR